MQAMHVYESYNKNSLKEKKNKVFHALVSLGSYINHNRNFCAKHLLCQVRRKDRITWQLDFPMAYYRNGQ